ncbi:MAG: hypothetical protein JST78_02085 [Bacteroidetes bacterium]|nr:hypothetical protein [Bacteroidota bacterium]
MKVILNTVIAGVSLLTIGCKKETETPKVSYEAPSKAIEKPKLDTTKVEIADLPIQFQGTQYLLFPIGEVSASDRGKSGYESGSSGSRFNTKISNYSENEITGYLRNIKFQNVKSDSLQALTNKPVMIQSVSYLKSQADKIKQQILVYLLTDADTNKDNVIDTNDIQTLYLSDISGQRFTKISADFQEVIDWNVIEAQNRLYFRALDDTNKDGAFDREDRVHYFYLDLAKDWKATEYQLTK